MKKQAKTLPIKMKKAIKLLLSAASCRKIAGFNNSLIERICTEKGASHTMQEM